MSSRCFSAKGAVFDNLGREHSELERIRIIDGEDGVTHIHYRPQP